MTGELQLALLGGGDVRQDGEPVTGFYSSKARALLFYLAVTGMPHSRPALAGLLWADMPEADARTNLRQALTNLRRLVGPYLSITRQMVAFNLDSPHWLDVEAFRAGVTDASDRSGSSDDEGVMERLREAVDLYQGDFLAGFYVRDAPVFEEWMLAQAAQLRTSALGALRVLAAYYARRGDYESGIATTRRLLELEPWHEGAHRQLMLLLARSGQRGAALAQYKACRQVLAEELGVEPAAETAALYNRIYVARSEARHNLPPQPTPLVGREDELAQLARHLADPDCRLLTIVGPGGMGKTRLALQTAEENAHLFLNGVTFVSLAPLASADSLVPAIADALQFPFSPSSDPQTQLLDHLQNQERLLVLDSFEHLLVPIPPAAPPSGGERGGASLLTQILAHAPDVKLLVTSRERLNLTGEWLFEVEGLAFPTTVDHAGRLEDYSAVQLFLGSAGRVRSGFSVTEAEEPDVVRICQLVAGMPLGIELAAAWARALSPPDIRREIERGLGFLTTSRRDAPARHRSITTLFEHSWALLLEAERRVFAGLSVFRGGFRREAARQVAGASLKVLTSLVDKSFLRLDSAGRYEMHELVRQYAADRLQETPGEPNATRECHCAYYSAFLQSREAHLKGGNQKEALKEIDEEIDNLRSSWRWAVEHERVTEVGQAAECLGIFYEIRGWWYEGESAYAEATEALETINRRRASSDDQTIEEAIDMALGAVLTWRGVFTYRLGLYEKSEELTQRSLALLRQTGRSGSGHMALSLMNLGNVVRSQGHLAEAQQLYEETYSVAQEAGDGWGILMAFNGLGSSALQREDYAQARQFLQGAIELAREAGDEWGLVFQLGALSDLANILGEYGEAEQLAQEGYAVAKDIDHREGVAFALQSLGRVACGLGKCQAARDYLQEALLIGMDIQARPTILDILPDLATVLVASDGSDAGREQAVELLAHCLNHPATGHDTKLKAEPMLAELETHLPPEVVARAQERGKAKALEVAVAEVLAETA